MSSIAKYVQQTFRFVAVVAAVAALLGVGALAAVGLKAAAASGMSVPVTVPMSGSEARQLAFLGAGAFFGGLVLNLLANTVASFAAGFRSGPARPGGGVARPTDGAESASTVPVSERYRAKLEGVYLWLAGSVAVLAAVSLAGSGSSATSALGLVFLFATVSVKVFFGGVAGAVGTVAVLLGLRYGVGRKASEALVAGFVVALLFLPTAILSGSPALVLFALTMLYYNFFARGATEFRWVRADEVPGAVRRFVG